MNRFVNGAAIALVAFVVVLGGYWALAKPSLASDGSDAPDVKAGSATSATVAKSQRPPTSGTSGEAPHVGDVSGGWDGDGDLRLQLDVVNPTGAKLEATRLELTFRSGGKDVQGPGRDLGIEVPARSAVPLEVEAPVPNELGRAWWDGLADGKGDLRIDGRITVDGPKGATDLPFSLARSADDPLAPLVAHAKAQDCEGGVCASVLDASWHEGALRVKLELKPSAGADVRSVAAALEAHGATIASADGNAPDGDGTVRIQVDLAPRDLGLAAWWPAHAADCERSTLVLRLDVSTVGADDAAASNELALDLGTLRTGYLCGGA